MFLDENLLKTLVDKILERFGKKNLLPADCKVLSSDIYSKTEKSISETTLKRLFGFAKRSFDFSIYTLDTLATYLGYENWNSFYELNQAPNERQMHGGNKWQELRMLCTKHSQYTLQGLKNSSGIHFTKTIEREKLSSFIQKFLLTGKSIAPIVGPSGAGKSIGLAHSALKLWLDDKAVYPNDICCFINIHQIHTIATYKHSLFEWFNKYLGLLYNDIAVLEAEKNKEDRLVLIIDGFDDRAFSSDKLKLIYSNIIEFINYNNEYSWIKIILSLRPTAWSKLVQAYFNPSFFMNRIFIDDSYPQENYQNHTLPFNFSEIEKVLQLHQVDKNDIACYSTDFINLISFPRYLDIFCTLINTNFTRKRSQEQIIYKLIETDIKHYFLFDAHTSTKSKIIEKMVELKASPYGQNNIELKEWSLVKDALTASSFCQLIDDYLVTEEKEYGNTAFPIPKINFTNPFLENYFVSWVLLKEQQYNVTRHLIDSIYLSEEFSHMKQSIVKWFLLHLLQSFNFSSIEEIFCAQRMPEEDKFVYFEFLVELTDTDKQRNEILVPLERQHHFIQSFFEQGIYYHYCGVDKEKVLYTLARICDNKIYKHNFLCLLFVNSMLQLKVQNAEMYLREYRQLSRHENNAAITVQEKLMEYTLDFARYSFKNDSVQALIDELAALQLTQAPYTELNYLSMLLLTHALLYTEDYERLYSASAMLQQQLSNAGGNAYQFLNRSLQLLHEYASLMCKGLQPATEKSILQLVHHKNNSFQEADSMLNTFSALLLAKLHEKKQNSNLAIQYANEVYSESQFNCLRIYKLLAFKILKDAYASNNLREKVLETDEKIKELFTHKYDDKINYDLKETFSFYPKSKFL
ncbi:hypothetical protein DXN05_21195 [Deminuibacter soli]|uniref:NACHT domain-containing protein n=2 Tax=Deminuibacter soli TaxID=2291815 RepID=A0A3E1NDT0_9BACT|nr:hypothetical protein DXN05_21195 [Deminuibacter soli]